jgi:hypothetical protein
MTTLSFKQQVNIISLHCTKHPTQLKPRLLGVPYKDFAPFLSFYDFENVRTLKCNLFVSRKSNMKLGLQVVNFRNHYVVNDILATVFTGIKIFFEINTGLRKYYTLMHPKKEIPLTQFTRRRPKLFFYKKHLLYLTHRFMTHRNVLVRVNVSKKGSYRDISFFRRLRPLNRMLFATLLLKLKSFSFKLPLWIKYKARRASLQVNYIGFKFRMNRRNIARGILKDRRSRRPQVLLSRCRTSRRYFHYCQAWAKRYLKKKNQSIFTVFRFKYFLRTMALILNSQKVIPLIKPTLRRIRGLIRAKARGIRIKLNRRHAFIFNNQKFKEVLKRLFFEASQKWVSRRRKYRMLRKLLPLEKTIKNNQNLLSMLKCYEDDLVHYIIKDVQRDLKELIRKRDRLRFKLYEKRAYLPCLGKQRFTQTLEPEIKNYFSTKASRLRTRLKEKLSRYARMKRGLWKKLTAINMLVKKPISVSSHRPPWVKRIKSIFLTGVSDLISSFNPNPWLSKFKKSLKNKWRSNYYKMFGVHNLRRYRLKVLRQRPHATTLRHKIPQKGSILFPATFAKRKRLPVTFLTRITARYPRGIRAYKKRRFYTNFYCSSLSKAGFKQLTPLSYSRIKPRLSIRYTIPLYSRIKPRLRLRRYTRRLLTRRRTRLSYSRIKPRVSIRRTRFSMQD